MKRILATAKFIDASYDLSKDFLVLTPNPSAAARLNVRHRSLRRVATEILARKNIGVASPLRSMRVLKSVCGVHAADRDPAAEMTRIRPILATVLRDGINLAAMEKSGIRSAEQVAKVIESYTEELWKDRLVDAEAVLWRAGEVIAERRKIFVYGYFRARESDIRFIHKLAGDGSIFVVPSGTESIFASANRSIELLRDGGWEMLSRDAKEQSNMIEVAARFASGNGDLLYGDECKAFAYPNVDAEVRATLATAKKLVVEGTAPDRIAIVCRKAADYERTTAAVAKEYGMSISIDSSTALSDTKLGSYIDLLLEAAGSDLEFAVTARLLNHPYGKILTDEIWTLARRKRPSSPDAWQEVGLDLGSFAAGETGTLGNWVGWLLENVPPSLIRERSAEDAAELIAYEQFREAIGELKALAGDDEMDLANFSNAVREILETFGTPTNPGRGGIAFHQPNTIVGAVYDHVFVVGTAEGMLPATTNEDAVIDFYEQRELEEKGVTFDPPVEFPRWEALSFYYVLLAAGKSITISYPKAIDIDEKIASPFFERLGITPVEAKPDSIASPHEELKVFLRHDDAAPSTLLGAARHQFEIERRRESSNTHDEYDGVIGIPIKPESRIWSASQLTKIGQCAFKWFAEKALRLAPIDQADTDLRSSVMGRLYHKTLQLAVDRAKDAPDFREAVLKELEPAFREAEADDEIAVSELPNWEHRRSEHLTILRKTVESPEFIAESARVVATEKSFDVKCNGFAIRGSIDRVDETPEGFVAIDYKTGAYIGRIKDENGELKTDIQLPIYSKVALESQYPGRVAAGHYYSIRQQKILSKEKTADIVGYVNEVRQRLEAGDLAVDPDIAKKSCKYCEYDPVCRQGQRNARKRK